MMFSGKEFCYAIGLMSGTSVDGIDAAVVKIYENDDIRMELVHFDSIQYEAAIRNAILALCNPKQARIEMISGMNMLLGELFSDAVRKVIQDAGLQPEDISFISSHGQTIFHQPEPQLIGKHPVTSTLQIGDISMIAERTGITTVGDFRTRDMAVGGQGAPLVPYADYLLFRHREVGRVLVNIGGISNLTVLPANAEESDVLAYDTGPGNMIIDYFANQITHGKRSFDQDGRIASAGKVHGPWLEELLREPYYSQTPPKSTGRELFGEVYARKLWDEANRLGISEEDRIATVTTLTAKTITNEIDRHMAKGSIREVYISGGGSNNLFLMKQIESALPNGVTLRRMDELGVSADAKEAMVFALLGYQYLNKRTNNLPSATGATKKVMMGKVAWGS
ncbi:anhydro-N-acetylmuramic acid kinase [Ornithinibacillus bavariensis]|uniref:anhydro-N-acetylmuramic acid kinase n=1 Tax=Ornithinibacillus bavariensis TaxID=545502 RepID=UPI003D1FADF0